MPDTRRVHLYPVEGWYLPGVRAVERIVPAEMADYLTSSPNPAFTRTRPDGQRSASADALEDTSDIEANVDRFRPAVPVAATQTVEEAAAAASETGGDSDA